jgi:hypothetical protein
MRQMLSGFWHLIVHRWDILSLSVSLRESLNYLNLSQRRWLLRWLLGGERRAANQGHESDGSTHE